MRTDLDRAIDAVARRQHWAFHRSQAIAAGFNPGNIAWRLDSGLWVALDRSVYALAASPATWKRRVMAATLSRPGSLASGRTAAALYEIPPFRPGRVEVTAPMSANARSRLYVVRRCRHFDHIESAVVDDIPVMTPAETMFDLARREPGLMLRRSVEEAIIAKTVTIEQLEATCGRRFEERCPSARPMARILDDLALGEPIPESEVERLLHRVLDHPEIPPVVRQAPLPWRRKENRRVDVLIDPWLLIIEGDGLRWHARYEAMERDRARDNDATAHGYRVLRFTYWMLRDHPNEALDLILRVGRLAA